MQNVVKRAAFSTLKQMSKDFLVHLHHTKAPTLSVVYLLACLFASPWTLVEMFLSKGAQPQV